MNDAEKIQELKTKLAISESEWRSLAGINNELLCQINDQRKEIKKLEADLEHFMSDKYGPA